MLTVSTLNKCLLEPVVVSAAALSGGYLGDELCFSVARRYGAKWIEGKQRLENMMTYSERLLKR